MDENLIQCDYYKIIVSIFSSLISCTSVLSKFRFVLVYMLYIRNVYHPLSHLRVHTESRSREDVNEGETKVGVYKRRVSGRNRARMR